MAALLGALSFPPIGLWFLAYVALIPFLIAATSGAAGRPFRTAYGAGLVFFGGTLYWVGLNSGAPWFLSAASCVAMVLILATVWGITAWAVATTTRRAGLTVAVLLFVALYQFQEIFWGNGELGFPWAVWALTQTSFLPAIQIADLVDVWGVSLWVLVINALGFVVWRRRCAGAGIALAGLFLIPIVYGMIRMPRVDRGETVSVAAIQANTPAEMKWHVSAEQIFEDHVSLTRELTASDVALVVWPETATPLPLRFRQWARSALYDLTDSLGATLLTGATDYDAGTGVGRIPYNAAFAVQPGIRAIQRAAKVHLVPFGERIPWQEQFPFLGSIRLGQAEFVPGEKPIVFRGDPAPDFGCLICFEVVFPGIAAALVRDGAKLFAHITNDGWYGDSSGPYQHLHLARLRAVACRRSMVRAANTGISALICPSGRFIETLGYDRAGSIRGELPVRSETTIAVRIHRFWYPFYTALLALVLGVVWLRRRRPNGLSLNGPAGGGSRR